MELSQLKSRINDAPEGFFIFAGEEEYLKRYYLDELLKSVVPDEFLRPFNYALFDGPEIDFGALADAITSPPMMADRKLVVWKWAELDKLKEAGRTALEELARGRAAYGKVTFVIVVSTDSFDVGTLPKRPSKLYTRLCALYDIVHFPLSTDTQLLAWLKRHFDAEGISVDAATLRALLFRTGHAMDDLYQEVKKLTYYARANGRDAIDIGMVESVSATTVECDTFALSNAVLERNHALAYRALSVLKRERTDPIVILGMLSRSFSELYAVAKLGEEGERAERIGEILHMPLFKVKLTLGAVRRYETQHLLLALEELSLIDEKAKSYGNTGYAAIESFLAKNL